MDSLKSTEIIYVGFPAAIFIFNHDKEHRNVSAEFSAPSTRTQLTFHSQQEQRNQRFR